MTWEGDVVGLQHSRMERKGNPVGGMAEAQRSSNRHDRSRAFPTSYRGFSNRCRDEAQGSSIPGCLHFPTRTNSSLLEEGRGTEGGLISKVSLGLRSSIFALSATSQGTGASQSLEAEGPGKEAQRGRELLRQRALDK